MFYTFLLNQRVASIFTVKWIFRFDKMLYFILKLIQHKLKVVNKKVDFEIIKKWNIIKQANLQGDLPA